MAVAVFAPLTNDPLWLIGQIAVVAVIGVMIYLGYRVISNSGNKNKKSDERRR